MMFANLHFHFYKLAPFTSLFDKVNVLRAAKQKSKLTNTLKYEVINFLTCHRFVDGCAVFWEISWPKKGTLKDLHSKLCYSNNE